jgi:hypothetical protein
MRDSHETVGADADAERRADGRDQQTSTSSWPTMAPRPPPIAMRVAIARSARRGAGEQQAGDVRRSRSGARRRRRPRR